MISSRSMGTLALLFFLLCGGCRSNPWMKTVEQMELRISALPESVSPGEEMPVILELSNKGDHDLDLCFGEPIFHLMGSREVKSRPIPIVDHIFCDEMKTVKAGATRSWEEQVVILLEKTGEAKIYLTLEVVNPNNCDSRYGCKSILLHSQISILISDGK